MKYIVTLMLSVLMSTTVFAINGAAVQVVTIDHNQASVTVLNQSAKSITGFSIALRATFPDGHTESSVATKDYGPLTGNVLAPKQMIIETETYGAEPSSVEAIVVVAIYKDGTAEADDDSVLNGTIAVRKGIAKALRLSANTLNAALQDAHPSAYARTKLTLATDDKSLDKSYLKSSLEVVDNAAKNGNERDFLQQNAVRYNNEATAFEAYSNIRRVQ